MEGRFRFIEGKQPIRLDDGTEAYENRTNNSWRNYILNIVETHGRASLRLCVLFYF
jgi:hypothetical protein